MSERQVAAAAVHEKRIKVLMVDDQAIFGASVQKALEGESDIDFHFCQDPVQALKLAKELKPTVILQDLVMPDVDGLMLVRLFRGHPATRDTPMVVLSSKEEPETKAQAFALGANDYLVKLPDKLELLARIRYHSGAYLNLLDRNEAYRQLAESQRQLAEEVAQAASYVQSILPEQLKGPVQAQWRFVPSTQLGGDMFGYHWLDPDHLAMYLLDVSGHGVGSCLLAVSAHNALAAQSLPNTDFRSPAAVLKALNNAFTMEKQNYKFFTIWYGVYRRPDRTLLFANGGHPPALLFDGSAGAPAKPQLLEAQNMAIGIAQDVDCEETAVSLPENARLLLYSDGVFEIEKTDGVMWQFGEFLEYLSTLPASGSSMMDQLLAHVRQLHSSDVLADDFSIVEVRL